MLIPYSSSGISRPPRNYNEAIQICARCNKITVSIRFSRFLKTYKSVRDWRATFDAHSEPLPLASTYYGVYIHYLHATSTANDLMSKNAIFVGS